MWSLGTASVCAALLLLTPSASHPLAKAPNAAGGGQHGHPKPADWPLDFHETNPEMTPFGRLVEGDLLRSPIEKQRAKSRGVSVIQSRLWPNRLYRYHIGDGVERAAVEAGVQFWRDNTCISFQEVPDDSREPRVTFIASGTGCWSWLGFVARYQTDKFQALSIDTGCTSLGAVTHEIAHSLSFYHEHNRSDRDGNVEILWDNIQNGMEGNFAKEKQTRNDLPYDLTSIMHYGAYAFSSNGQPTIRAKDPALQGLIGQGVQPSFRDVALMNRLYKCEELCASPPACQNGGYVTADCVCHCPPNNSGAACDTITTG